jgi:flavin-dependent dehydrogenase
VRPREFDVVVAGAGPAGCAAAIALCRAGRRVLLADPSLGQRRALRAGETLPAVAATVLRDLSLPEIAGAGVAIPSTGTSASWGGDGTIENDAIADPLGHGWHLDRTRFDSWLTDQACAAGAELQEGRVVAEPWPSAAQVRLEGPGTTDVACRWVVDATGRHAALARRQGARRERHDRLVALYAAVSTGAGSVDARVRLEATPSGWWYSALVGSGRRIVAFLTDSDLLDPAWRSRPGFGAALETTSHVLPVGGWALTSGPATTAAHGTRVMPAAGDRWLAVGDAALAFDPLSSQGILNALATGLEGAAVVDASLRGKGDAVARYAQRLTRVWSAYEVNRAGAYALERRWPDAAFWERRATIRAVAPRTPRGPSAHPSP